MKLKCIVSGLTVNVPVQQFKARAVKYGVSEDALKTGYVCRDSKRLIREGKTVEEIRATSGIKGLPDVDPSIITKVIESDPKASKKKKAVAAKVDAVAA